MTKDKLKRGREKEKLSKSQKQNNNNKNNVSSTPTKNVSMHTTERKEEKEEIKAFADLCLENETGFYFHYLIISFHYSHYFF